MPRTASLDRLFVVAEPWESLLVDGDKTWDLRTTSTRVRGPVGVAAKGTGTIIGKVDQRPTNSTHTDQSPPKATACWCCHNAE